MRPIPRLLAAVVVLVLAVAGPPSPGAAPEIDLRARNAAGRSAIVEARARWESPALRSVARVAHVDERFGTPTFLWGAAAGSRGGAAATANAAEAARGHLARLAPFYGLGRADLESATLRHVHDTGRGGIIATYVQRIDGIEVFGEEVKLLLGRDRTLLAASGSIAGRGAGVAGPFRLSSSEAVARAVADFTGGPAPGVRSRGALQGGFEGFDPIAGEAEPIRAKRVLFHLPGRLEPAYSVEILGGNDARLYVISAVDGGLLFRHGLIADAAYSYRAWTDPGAPFMPLDGPQGSAPSPHPTGSPGPYAPVLTVPGLVDLQNGPISTNDPWLPPGATVSTGNNVDAYADLTSPDGFSGSDLRANPSGPSAFDYTYDTSLAPNASLNQRKASVTQLFYTTNFLHDWYYDAGFDEAAGNAQAVNYGRGGVEGDRMRAEAQDYGGTGNANMSTPQDGGTPRMQMYVFPVAASAEMTVSSGSLNGSLTIGTANFGPQAYSVTAQVVLVVDAVAPVNDGCTAPTNAGRWPAGSRSSTARAAASRPRCRTRRTPARSA